MSKWINVCQSTTCLKMMSKHIESYEKHALAVNQRHPKKTMQEAILCFTYLRFIEKGLVLAILALVMLQTLWIIL